MCKHFSFLAVVVLLNVTAQLRADSITTENLLDDLVDLHQLAEFPAPAYTARQASSYDRASTSPSNPATWFANNDRGQYLRDEQHGDRVEHVMMEAKGPGAIVRIWSANPHETIRIYLDDQPTPVIETPMKDLLSGAFAGIPAPIAAEASRGFTSYFPISYSQSCKVTADAKDLYYHVDYRTYDAGTPVTSFKLADLKDFSGTIQSVAATLAGPNIPPAGNFHRRPFSVSINPGDTTELENRTGPAEIVNFQLQVNPTSPNLDAALRGVIVQMRFDGEQTVEAPLGDFFGAAPGINPYTSLPLGVKASAAMYCHWVMPFEKSAVVSLRNSGAFPITLSGELWSTGHPWDERSMHFHAGYRAQYDVPTQPRQDWNYLTAAGKGVFAGVAFAIDNPNKAWWGEGDEKIYVDSESFPSWFGTGSEDYFGYAWCSPITFTHAFHDQSRCDGPGNYGRTSVNRFHIIDRIPFQKTFRFDMELWHWRNCNVNLAATTYWYAVPGGTSEYAALRPDDLVVKPMPAYQPVHVPGVLEAEDLRIVEHTGEVTQQQWPTASGEMQLWWHGAKLDDRLILEFPVAKAGRYRVTGRFLRATDYGIDQVAINGTRVDHPIDFYGAKLGYPPTDDDLGDFDLKEGLNQMEVAIVGSNPSSKGQMMFGMDYLRLAPTTAASQPESSR